jgi:integrase
VSTIHTVFSKFTELGSARKVWLWFRSLPAQLERAPVVPAPPTLGSLEDLLHASAVVDALLSRLTIRDLRSDDFFVRIVGKGRKERQCPLWERTVEALQPLITNRMPGTAFS